MRSVLKSPESNIYINPATNPLIELSWIRCALSTNSLKKCVMDLLRTMDSLLCVVISVRCQKVLSTSPVASVRALASLILQKNNQKRIKNWLVSHEASVCCNWS